MQIERQELAKTNWISIRSLVMDNSVYRSDCFKGDCPLQKAASSNFWRLIVLEKTVLLQRNATYSKEIHTWIFFLARNSALNQIVCIVCNNAASFRECHALKKWNKRACLKGIRHTLSLNKCLFQLTCFFKNLCILRMESVSFTVISTSLQDYWIFVQEMLHHLKQSKTSVENQGILHYTTWILHLKENLPEIARLRYFFDITVEDHQNKMRTGYIYISIWLVVWNICYFSIYILEIIIPTGFHVLQRGWNHQPDI